MYAPQHLPLPPLTVFQVGARNRSRIVSGLRTGFFILVLTATLTLAGGPATLILNDGSLAAQLQFAGLEEGGSQDPANLDGVSLMKLTELSALNLPRNVRLTATANGAYNLREYLVIPFAWPSPNPWETSFVERDKSQPSNLFITPFSVTDAATRIVSTPGTAVLTNFTWRSYQIADDRVGVANCTPYFRPKIRQVVQQIAAGAFNNMPVYCNTTLPLRAVGLSAMTPVGIVDDVLTSYTMQTDLIVIDGPGEVNFQDMEFMQGLWMPGIANGVGGIGPNTALSRGQLWRSFQGLGGRLSLMFNPARQGPNFRFNITGLSSVTAGATSQNAVVTLVEMERIAGVTTENIPFPY